MFNWYFQEINLSESCSSRALVVNYTCFSFVAFIDLDNGLLLYRIFPIMLEFAYLSQGRLGPQVWCGRSSCCPRSRTSCFIMVRIRYQHSKLNSSSCKTIFFSPYHSPLTIFVAIDSKVGVQFFIDYISILQIFNNVFTVQSRMLLLFAILFRACLI